MMKQKGNDLLKQLHKELSNSDKLDEKSKELLQILKNDINHALAKDHSDSDYNDLITNLSSSIQHFEVTHPTLTASLMHFRDFLSGIGL